MRVLCIVPLLLIIWSATSAPAGAPGEYQVKAAILFNLAKFVEWPEDAFSDPSAPIVIGVLGDDPFGGHLDAARDRAVKGRKAQVMRFGSVQTVRRCHILFISSSEKRRMAHILSALGESATLLVGDMEKFAARGGMIGLIVRNEMVDFEINVDAVQRAGLKISPRILNQAHIVREGEDRQGQAGGQ